MKKELLSEIKRMQELAGILNEKLYTQQELMNQNLPKEVEIQKIDEKPEDEESTVEKQNDEVEYVQDLPAEIIPVLASEKEIASAEEIVANAENLYPGTKYHGSYDALTPMGESVISALGDDEILILDI